MNLQENYCYTVLKDFKAGYVHFKKGEEIEIDAINDKEVYFSKKKDFDELEPSSLSESFLSNYIDVSAGYKYFGTCENCGCDLSYMPNAGWGVGYVCAPCAREIRGEC
ncbi:MULTISPECIES: hypothetical protein [Enterococcus]|uniref:hypothetical protein n=1 Tax=Enterococcus TaxID=1350 RepID=UPI0008A4ADF9|nr:MULTISPECIES: hypothetical protein [Enterococcus]MDB1729502.1 hypothetical protein [Enterococcus avium]MDB1733578.1 hypothetical protein [Enterococcus avium]OFL82156.1 hypothetical protein HMPREF2742_08810 [Enterococcus sp. HMSC072H05]